MRNRCLSGLRLYTLAPYSPTLREGVMLEKEKPADLAPRARSSPEETPVGAPDEHLEAHLLLGLLTPREAEVLRLMVRGHTNREMAQRCHALSDLLIVMAGPCGFAGDMHAPLFGCFTWRFAALMDDLLRRSSKSFIFQGKCRDD